MEALIKTGRNVRPLARLGTRSIVILALVLFTLTQAMADGPRNRSHGGFGRGAESEGWMLGDHYQIYRWTGHDWRRVEGSAIDVADGWVIGTDRRRGGYGIYRWSGYRFERMPGAGVEIGGSYEHPWVINDRGERFEWMGHDWREVRGSAPYYSDRHHDSRRSRRPDW